MGWLARITGNLRTAAALRRAGVTMSSVLSYPVRRRVGRGLNRLELVDGSILEAPASEPLIAIFDEVWISQRYAEAGFAARPGHTIVDIGANMGVFTVWAARRNPQAVVVSVEPGVEACGLLRHNIELNRLANVRVVQAACSGQTGPRAFYRRGDTAQSSLYNQDVYGSEFLQAGEVATVTLQELFAQQGIECCDLLKLDCEGAEYEILMNAPAAVLQRVERIAMEYHLGMNAHHPAELKTCLEAHGFLVDYEPPIDDENGYLYGRRGAGAGVATLAAGRTVS